MCTTGPRHVTEHRAVPAGRSSAALPCLGSDRWRSVVRRGGRSARPLVAVASVLLVAIVAAAVAAPWEFEYRDLPAWLAQFEFTLPEFEFEDPAEGGPGEGEVGDGWNLGWVVALVQVLVAGLVLLLLRWLWLRFRHSQVAERVRPSGYGGAVPAEVEQPDLPILRQGVSAARTVLDGERDPTEAIVAAWLALEHAAASAGVTRRPAQTPSEFTVEVLDRLDADPDATRRLLDLYLRARFSGLPSDDADVEVARTCLVTLAEGWQELAAHGGVRR